MVRRKLYFSEAYNSHHIFDDINDMQSFYNSLSMGCFQFVPTGAPYFPNYASYVYLAIEGTLESISTLLKIGRINDSYVLVRKLFDDVLVDIYIDVVKKEKYDWVKNVVVDNVDTWLKGKIRIPKLELLLKVIREAKLTKDIYPYFGWKSYLKNNRELLDDSVHSNRYSRLLLNCNEVAAPNRERHLNNIAIILNQIFTMHLSFVFHMNPEYLMSSDYMDYLNDGETPPKGCESWIAPYAQKAFDKYIKPHDSLAKFIKGTCYLEIN